MMVTLVQLKGIGEEYSEDEAWFAEDALRKEESDLLNGVSFN